jgi:hypothetical protein
MSGYAQVRNGSKAAVVGRARNVRSLAIATTPIASARGIGLIRASRRAGTHDHVWRRDAALARSAAGKEGLPNPAVDACAACSDGRALSEPNRARAPICPTRKFRMRAMRELPVVPIWRMYRCLRRRANRNDPLAHPASMKRDVSADRHNT